MSGRALYEWTLVGEGGAEAWCSAGIGFKLDGDLEEVTRDDTVLVCGGIDVGAATTKRVISWLRREARKGATMGGLCTAGYTLAKAGLLDGKRATIHWENQDSFAEEFEDVTLTKSVFVIDGNRITTAGGTAIHRPDAQDHRRRSWRGPRQSRRRSVDLYVGSAPTRTRNGYRSPRGSVCATPSSVRSSG